MTLRQSSHIHFTGIKGVGMAATAYCAQDLGISVSGSDLSEEFVTDKPLSKRNVKVSSGFSPEHIPEQTDLLVYTGAHEGPKNPQVKAAKSRGVRTISQAQAVGELMTGKLGISVCGVGGKTTTSAMIATILSVAGKNPSYLIGVGSINNLDSPGKFDSKGNHFIAEADEYVTAPGIDPTPRFMFQDPQIIVCTNIAHDHPDVYKNLTSVKKAYQDFFKKLGGKGLLIINGDDTNTQSIISPSAQPKTTYGKSQNCDFHLVSTKNEQESQLVTFKHLGKVKEFSLSTPGEYNAMNALAAYATCTHLGLTHQQIAAGLKDFTGTKRRFEKIKEIDQIAYFDDYAHHPSEIKAVLGAVKSWLPNRRLIVVFQPHTYSRTKALFSEFSQSFSLADEVIITPIFASSREQKDPTVNSTKLTNSISKHHQNTQYLDSFAKVVKYLLQSRKPGDVIITLGAGDIYKIHERL